MTTPIQWASLSARERHELIATKVMGWTRRGYYRNPALEKNPFYDIWFDYPNSRYKYDIREWHPTEDPRATLEIVEAMRGRGFLFTLHRSLGGLWTSYFWNEKETHCALLRDSMAESVAVAALRAVGLEVEG